MLALRDSRDLLGAHGFDLGAEMGLSVPRASNIVPRRQQGAHPVGQTARTPNTGEAVRFYRRSNGRLGGDTALTLASKCGAVRAARFAVLEKEQDIPVADIPDRIVLKRDRDLDGRGWEIWVRRGLFVLLPLVALLGLLNIFGQHPQTLTKSARGASLKLSAPARVRSGLIYQARFHITTQRDLKQATLVLSPGWLESMTVNTIEPSPVNEGSNNGKLTLGLGHIPAGSSHLLFMQFQTNPTNAGHRDASVELRDGDQSLFRLHRTITVFP